MKRVRVATLMQIGGLSALTVGAFILAVWLGWMVGGAALTLTGLALERDDAR